ncbi:MAG TPA: hypothetical protein VGJ53_08535 [Micromonosporaceae bacterium]|jgi:hypothetical protein
MNLGLLIPALILAPCAGFGLVVLPKIWTAKATGPRPEYTRRRWSFRDARQLGYVRGLPSAILGLTAIVLSMLAVVVEEATTGTVSDVARRVALWTFVAFVAFLLIGVSVTLFNRPKLAVPPAARDEPGALALWWRGRRQARR